MRDELTLRQWQYLASLSVTNRTLVLCQKPPKRRQTSKAPKPIRKEPPSKANSFGVCTIGMRAEPVSNTPKKSKGNLKAQHVRWLRFRREYAPIYASSWNLRNNLTLRLACSIELNALSEQKFIGRLIGCACDGVIAIVVSIASSQLVTTGIPTDRAKTMRVQQFLRIPKMGDDS